jgi:hypothetical protein
MVHNGVKKEFRGRKEGKGKKRVWEGVEEEEEAL